ncbi:MAG: glycyl-radical enzyme activating protein [Syntrophales bacterium]|nr:glycyl-radical enzyme activating protein [Syntrophales bacterium]
MIEESGVSGVVYDIQRMSTCDGPGIRTTVFLKGCYLNCEWCHNPEGKRRYPEVIPYLNNCTGCKDCLAVCPASAITMREDNVPFIDKSLCFTCLECVKTCKENALIWWGRILTVTEVMEEVEQDKQFYENSGGGMTVSGGEPMVQPLFVYNLMKEAKNRDIKTALDTCGYAPWADLERVLEFTDLVLFDVKNMDSRQHREYSGCGNEQILENARRIAEKGLKMRIRVPIIPGRNDSMESLEETAKFVQSLGDVVLGVDLLSYHPYAGAKYKTFGMDYEFPLGEGMDEEKVKPVIDLFLNYVEEVTVGG